MKEYLVVHETKSEIEVLKVDEVTLGTPLYEVFTDLGVYIITTEKEGNAGMKQAIDGIEVFTNCIILSVKSL